jgi:hypothetical protein
LCPKHISYSVLVIGCRGYVIISSVTMIYHTQGQGTPQDIRRVLFHLAAWVSMHPRRGWYSYQYGQSLLACGCMHKVTSTQASAEGDHPSHSRISQQDWHFLFGKNTPNPTGPKNIYQLILGEIEIYLKRAHNTAGGELVAGLHGFRKLQERDVNVDNLILCFSIAEGFRNWNTNFLNQFSSHIENCVFVDNIAFLLNIFIATRIIFQFIH